MTFVLQFIVAVCKLWPTCFCIRTFISTQPYIFVYILCMAGFVLQPRSWMVAPETIWLTKLKICTIWSFAEKGCLLLAKSFDDPLQSEITSVATTERKASIFLLSLLYTEWMMGLIRKHLNYIQYLFEGVYGREGREKNVHFLRRTFNDLLCLIFFQKNLMFENLSITWNWCPEQYK